MDSNRRSGKSFIMMLQRYAFISFKQIYFKKTSPPGRSGRFHRGKPHLPFFLPPCGRCLPFLRKVPRFSEEGLFLLWGPSARNGLWGTYNEEGPDTFSRPSAKTKVSFRKQSYLSVGRSSVKSQTELSQPRVASARTERVLPASTLP